MHDSRPDPASWPASRLQLAPELPWGLASGARSAPVASREEDDLELEVAGPRQKRRQGVTGESVLHPAQALPGVAPPIAECVPRSSGIQTHLLGPVVVVDGGDFVVNSVVERAGLNGVYGNDR